MKATMSRQAARSVSCPECGAEPGERCQGVRRERQANHQERVDAAKAAAANPSGRDWNAGVIGATERDWDAGELGAA
jgi:hypothetical protein